MRTLVVAYEYPWPANSGSRLRLLTALHALCRSYATHLFSIASCERTDIDEPDQSFGLVNVGPVLWGQARRCVARRLVPPAHPLPDRDRVSCALARFTAGTYDQVSFFDVRSWIFAGADVAPAVID